MPIVTIPVYGFVLESFPANDESHSRIVTCTGGNLDNVRKAWRSALQKCLAADEIISSGISGSVAVRVDLDLPERANVEEVRRNMVFAIKNGFDGPLIAIPPSADVASSTPFGHFLHIEETIK